MRDTILQQQIKRQLIFCWHDMENNMYRTASVS
jgi:hypothetical protein